MQTQTDTHLQRLLKISFLIQSNCQYITTLQKCITQQQSNFKDTLPTFQQYIKQTKNRISEEYFIQCFIQLTYFIFSCRRYNISPIIGLNDVKIKEISMKGMSGYIETRFYPVIWYGLNDQKPFQSQIALQMIKDIYTYLFQKFLQLKQQTPVDKFKQYIIGFGKQCQYIYNDLSRFKQNKQKQFFLCLQQTIIFKEYSTLLKIKNSSILDLIKTNQVNFAKFKQWKQKDVQLVVSYSNQKKKQKVDHQKIKQKEKEIETNIMALFKWLGKKQTDKNQTMVNQGSEQTNKGQSVGKQQQKIKITYKYKDKPPQNFSQSISKIMPEFLTTVVQESQNQPNQPKKQQIMPQTQYMIEYSSDRNSICVRLIPGQMVVHIQNSDFLMYQSNILTFETINVNIQLVEIMSEATKKNTKKLAFKGTSCLNIKQPPLQKILLLMDATMIASKICQPQFNFNKVAMSCMNDHDRLTLISNKINHYTKIFLKCAKKVYSQ